MPPIRFARPTRGRLVRLEPMADTDADRAGIYDANLCCMIEDCFGEPARLRPLGKRRRRQLEKRLSRRRWRAIDPSRGFPGTASFWLTVNGARVGTIGLLDPTGRRYQPVAGLIIDPKHRGKGYAKDALIAMQKAAIRKKYLGISIETDWTFGPLAGIYLKWGFWVQNWKHYLTLTRSTERPPFEFGHSGSRAWMSIPGEEKPRFVAEARGDRLELAEHQPGGDDGILDPVVQLSTFSLHLATIGFPLVRSREQWQRAKENPLGPDPECLGRRIIEWEAHARLAGETISSPRIPGLPYRSHAELFSKAVADTLFARLKILLSQNPSIVIKMPKSLGKWRGVGFASVTNPRRLLGCISVNRPAAYDLPDGASQRWNPPDEWILSDRSRLVEHRAGNRVNFPEIKGIQLDSAGLIVDLDTLYAGIELDTMALPADEST